MNLNKDKILFFDKDSLIHINESELERRLGNNNMMIEDFYLYIMTDMSKEFILEKLNMVEFVMNEFNIFLVSYGLN